MAAPTFPWVRAWLAASLLALAAGGCQRREAPAAADSLPSVAVQTMTIEPVARLAREEVVGTVRAKLHAAIEPKISARIEALLVAPGQPVKAGDVLALLDAREVQAKFDQATAMREQATRDLERARTLLAQKISTQADFDAAEARARVTAGALKEAETMLGYARVVAPFDGVITRKLADVGDLATPGRALLEMEDPRLLRFEADVPESLIAQVELGAKLPVRVGNRQPALTGAVAEVAPVADAASRTFLVKLDLAAAEGVRSGQFGRVLVPVGEVKSLVVPESAVITRGQMETIFVVEDRHARLRLVRTGRPVEGGLELLAGLTAGERIVISSAARLHDGQPLTLQP